jgi:hypothetical protein
MKDYLPAFPTISTRRNGPHNGMSLRDYFAAVALQGLLSNPNNNGKPENFVHDAYLYADIMMEKKNHDN